MVIGVLRRDETTRSGTTISTYNAMISACEKGRQWEKAFELFDDLKQRDLSWLQQF